MDGERRTSPAAQRNADPIAEVLRDVLPAQGLVLEVASGSGEHALHFARAFPHLLFQPTDADPVGLRSIAAWRSAEAAPNLLVPVHLDAASDRWQVDAADAILCINMVHISPWAATLGVMDGAARLLPPGGPLYLYGAYFRDGEEPAPSNLAFDESLRSRNPEWGVRRLEQVVEAAAERGLTLNRVVEMPANNLSLVFCKSA